MTENQIKQMMKMMNQSVTTAQETQKIVKNLEKDVAELKAGQKRLEDGQERMESDISELKDGQKRLEREMRANNRAVNELAGENLRIKSRVDELEQELPH